MTTLKFRRYTELDSCTARGFVEDEAEDRLNAKAFVVPINIANAEELDRGASLSLTAQRQGTGKSTGQARLKVRL